MISITNLKWPNISENPSIGSRKRQSRRRRIQRRQETMTSFVHVDHPTQHPGVMRAERVAESVKNLASRLDGTRAIATVLLAAIVASVVVVANEVVDTWTEGH